MGCTKVSRTIASRWSSRSCEAMVVAYGFTNEPEIRVCLIVRSINTFRKPPLSNTCSRYTSRNLCKEHFIFITATFAARGSSRPHLLSYEIELIRPKRRCLDECSSNIAHRSSRCNGDSWSEMENKLVQSIVKSLVLWLPSELKTPAVTVMWGRSIPGPHSFPKLTTLSFSSSCMTHSRFLFRRLLTVRFSQQFQFQFLGSGQQQFYIIHEIFMTLGMSSF